MLSRRKTRYIVKAQESIDKFHAMHGIHSVIPGRSDEKIQQQPTDNMHTQNLTHLAHNHQIQKNYRTREYDTDRTFSNSSQRHAHIHQPITLMNKAQQCSCHKKEQRCICHRRLAHIEKFYTACKNHRRPKACTFIKQPCDTYIHHHRGAAGHQCRRKAGSKFAVTEKKLSNSNQPIIYRRLIIPEIAKNSR